MKWGDEDFIGWGADVVMEENLELKRIGWGSSRGGGVGNVQIGADLVFS